MRWQTKNNLESAIIELTGRKELPSKLRLRLMQNPEIKAVWSYNKPITENVINTVARQLSGSRYYQFRAKHHDDVVRQLKARMRWKQIEDNLTKPQTPNLGKMGRAESLKTDGSPTGRRPSIPLAV